jgi:hypothetical protein
MTPFSPAEALSLLFAQPDVELEISDGAFIRVHAIRIENDLVVATAPRLSVQTGMTLTGRVIGPDGQPWAVPLHLEDASYHTPDLAVCRMRATGCDIDITRRSAQRVPIGGVAWLEAVNCRDIVDGDRVDGSLEDLSRTGVAFTTARVLREGDRLIFNGRFFADSISGEVRVASIRKASAPGQTVIGCRFIDIDADSIARIDRILSGGREPDNGQIDVSALRDLASGGEDDGIGWRGIFKRS